MQRSKRISSSENSFQEEIERLSIRFSQRGYPHNIIEEAKQRTQGKTREELLIIKEKRESLRIAFVSKYSTRSRNIRKIILNRWELLQNDPDLGNTFKEKPLFAYKRSKNIKEILTKKNTNKPEKNAGMKKCNNCICCSNVIQQDYISHPRSGEKIKLRQQADCNSMNVIYSIKCPCGLLYIGKTERKIKIRIGEHRSMIRNKNTNSNLVAHWLEANHSIAQVKFMVIEKVQHIEGIDMNQFLLQKEVFWTKRLGTMVPLGLNDKLDMSCFL